MTITPFDVFYEKARQGLDIRSQSELAAILGVHRSAITQAKHKNTVPGIWLLKLDRHLHPAPSWLKADIHGDIHLPALTREAIATVPRVRARLHAGGGSFETSPEIESYYAFSRAWLRRKGNPDRMVLMDIVGDSMSPVIEEGDTVLVDQSRTEIYAGGIYAVILANIVAVFLMRIVGKNLDA